MDSDEDETPSTLPLNLSKFAFPVSAVPSRATTTSAPSRASSVATGEALKKKTATVKKVQKVFSSEFTDADYQNVLSCIGCDAKWTTRKSAAQKVQHMRTCCKKVGYTQETIDVLLRKAVTESLKTAASSAPSPPRAESPTLFDQLNPPEQKKRRAKGPLPQTVVASLADTREEILNRARMILQGPTSPDLRHTQDLPPATQPFGCSKLGARRPKTTLFGADATSDDEASLSPAQKRNNHTARFNPVGRPSSFFFSKD